MAEETSVRDVIMNPGLYLNKPVKVTGLVVMIDATLCRMDVASEGAKLIVELSRLDPAMTTRLAVSSTVVVTGTVRKQQRRTYIEVSHVEFSSRAGEPEPAAAARTLTVLHMNDLYHCGDFEGMSERAVRMMLAMQPHVDALDPLITFGGDLLAPSLMSTLTRGRHMMEVLELLGAHVATFGNHDFDFGVDWAREVTTQPVLFAHEGAPRAAASAWVSSNLSDRDGARLTIVP